MPKVLFVATTVLFFKEFLLPFVQYFRRLGWQVDGAGGMNDGWNESVKAFNHVYELEMTRNPANPRNLLLGMRQLQQLVEQNGYQLVHVHTPIAALVVRLALRNLWKQGRVKIVYTAHGFHFHPKGNPLKNAFFYGMEWLGSHWTDYLVVMNSEDQAAAERLVGKERTVYMPGIGLDLQHYSNTSVTSEDVGAVQWELGLYPGQPYFLMIAEFIPRKRHKDALMAFAKLANPEARLVLAGRGVLQGEMEGLAQKLGIAQRVHFLGFRQDIPALIQGALATILPSEQEGLPRAIMESFGMGVPAIGTDIRGVRDLIQPDCGYLVQVGDVEAMTQAMQALLADPQRAKQMGQKGQERMRRYDLHSILGLHEELYHKALKLESQSLGSVASAMIWLGCLPLACLESICGIL